MEIWSHMHMQDAWHLLHDMHFEDCGMVTPGT